MRVAKIACHTGFRSIARHARKNVAQGERSVALGKHFFGTFSPEGPKETKKAM